MLFSAPRKLLQLNKQLPPLDLGYAEFLANLIGFLTCPKIVQGEGPAAHVKGEVLGQAGFVADVFEQVLQPARRPGEELFGWRILGQILLIGGDPVIGQGQFAFLVAVGRAGVLDKNLGTVGRIQLNMLEVDAESFALFDACGKQKINECIRPGVGFAVAAVTVGREQDCLVFVRSQNRGERADRRAAGAPPRRG